MPALSNEGQEELLSQPLVAKFASVAPDGAVRITPVWFKAENDGSIVHNTFADSALVRNVKENPSCSLLIDSTEWPYRGIHFWGTAAPEGPEDDEDGIADMFSPYLAGKMDPHEYVRALIGWGTRVYVRFRPERSTTWDFSKG